jgi:hypothetical protein
MAKLKYTKVARPVTQNVITSHTELKVCNKRIITHAAKMNKVPEELVEEVLSFVGGYTRRVIEAGIMETVMLPYFGKIKPKIALIEHQALLLQAKDNAKHSILKQIRKAKLQEDEIARGRRKP